MSRELKLQDVYEDNCASYCLDRYINVSIVVDDNTADDDATVIDDVWCGVSIGSQWATGAAKLIRRALPSNPLRAPADWPIPLPFA